ncbi:hypothetical protein TOPH_02831 [Tolypocladium ophioglossoides CBS 100239]|uniref:Extracellular membrane protein CFEM domain-containing protein n=1 Tax=Tolypocladium ophioglossoides (strain CBS 100239) TaxID=1163406 RepID=A0A0L0NE69_TOLOC|nr:hypothetical protein TOPH_02831 [Tolypocladium ophioglossoides CBS 100239]
MKTSLVGGLLLFGLAGGQSHGSSVAPACVVDCTKNMANQTAEGMRAVCHNVAKQRALFHCLLNACPSQSYGYALGYTISACSDLGARISPLHPIEVHHVAPAKRQNIPTEPGPVLPSPSTLHGGQILTFDHKFAVALDCNAGTDGLVTLSVPVPDSAATPVFDSNGGNPNPGDADRLGNNAAQGDTARQSQYPQQGPDGRNTYMEDPDFWISAFIHHDTQLFLVPQPDEPFSNRRLRGHKLAGQFNHDYRRLYPDIVVARSCHPKTWASGVDGLFRICGSVCVHATDNFSNDYSDDDFLYIWLEHKHSHVEPVLRIRRPLHKFVVCIHNDVIHEHQLEFLVLDDHDFDIHIMHRRAHKLHVVYQKHVHVN